MENELLSVVDSDDRVIETRRRGEIHALGLRHRAVHILVFNRQQQLFLQKRSMNKDINPGLWDTSAAGHVDDGENYDDCAIRELGEELGLCADINLDFLFKLPASAATGMEFIQVYRCRAEGPFKLNTIEIERGCWFRPDDVSLKVANNDENLTDSFKTIWKQLLLNSQGYQ